MAEIVEPRKGNDFERWMDSYSPGWEYNLGPLRIAELRTCWNAAQIAAVSAAVDRTGKA